MLTDPEWVGAVNYAAIAEGGELWRILGRTLGFSVLVVAGYWSDAHDGARTRCPDQLASVSTRTSLTVETLACDGQASLLTSQSHGEGLETRHEREC